MFNITIKIKKYIIDKLNAVTRPHIIYGFQRADGVYLKNTRISNTVNLDYQERLQIEDNVFIGHFVYMDPSNGIAIDEGCQITNFVSILTHSSHVSIRLYGSKYTECKDPVGYVKGKVCLGAYSFIGPHTIIMPNTTIGKGCIVSAYSFVKGDFPDFSIIAGNPAIVVGDTRKTDSRYLINHPELNEHYSAWQVR